MRSANVKNFSKLTSGINGKTRKRLNPFKQMKDFAIELEGESLLLRVFILRCLNIYKFYASNVLREFPFFE